MKIIYRKQFYKGFIKLAEGQKKAVMKALRIFREDPSDVRLHNHALKGQMKGMRAISAGFDLRIIFKEENGYLCVMIIAVGSHDEVY